ncbi:MAG: site-specific integrase [Epsilonproteobacteria bacterium]|nr:site-specific integrase [Campylobacterota bacterium]
MQSIQKSNNNTEFFLQESKTLDGFNFDPNLDIWKFTDATNSKQFIFSALNILEDKLYGLKRTFIWYLENYSINHAYNMYKYLKHLCKYLSELNNNSITKIDIQDLKNYKNYLNETQMYYLGSLSGFLQKWHEMGYPGLSKEAYDYLQEIRLKGNQKGTAVLTMDPHAGPFTDLELESIQITLNNKYANNEISDSDFLLVWLMIIYGSRPSQFALLKICDLQIIQRDDSSNEYIIHIPRVKNRKKMRSEFKKRILPADIGQLLVQYSEDVKNRFTHILEDLDQAPLFPSSNLNTKKTLPYHCTGEKITKRIQQVISTFNINSERTEEKLHITSTRFRRTIGTRAAMEGYGELIIAEILDHTDTQNAGVYVQSLPEIIERIDKAMAVYMAPIAQAFAGKLVKDKSTAIRHDDPSADIIDPKVDSSCKAMGKCGTYAFCALSAPLACYTCNSFQAWVDGPHEKLLEYLINERKRLLKTTDYRIASINDKTILAVALVILECKKYKETNQQEII